MRRHGAQFTDEPQLIDDTTFQAKLKTDRLLSVPWLNGHVQGELVSRLLAQAAAPRRLQSAISLRDTAVRRQSALVPIEVRSGKRLRTRPAWWIDDCAFAQNRQKLTLPERTVAPDGNLEPGCNV
jgi:hypothetical protein